MIRDRDWTKTYSVEHDTEELHIEIVKYTDGGYLGFLAHISPPEGRDEMEGETFFEFQAATEEEAMKLCKEFIKENFGEAWSVTFERETDL